MRIVELIAKQLASNLEMVKMTLADFSAADMLTRPCAGANHAAWQLGHLVVAETMMVGTSHKGAGAAAPAGWSDRFTKSAAAIDDPKAFPSKEELLQAFSSMRGTSIGWINSLSDEELELPPIAKLLPFAATLGALGLVFTHHTMMHVGQFQVIRRKLGKPVLF